jgi:GNAT superfamily N-acetyltransferase
MIDLRDASHVSLLFVDADHQRRGVGTALLADALRRHPETTAVTVNSGPSAVPAYLRLGFSATAREAETNGIHFVSMCKELGSRGQQAHQPVAPNGFCSNSGPQPAQVTQADFEPAARPKGGG